MQVAELRSAFYMKLGKDGVEYKTMVNLLHEQQLIDRGWQKAEAADFLASQAKLIFYGPDGKLLEL